MALKDNGGGGPARPPTIRDVAARAGVSTSTVSRALDERLPASNSAAVERARRAAEELGYQRDDAASNLRRGGTNVVGVLVPRLRDTVMAMLYEHIAFACERRSLFAIVATSHEDPDREREAVDSLVRRRVDGLITTTARIGESFTEGLRARGLPYVLALRTDGRSPSSVGDDELGGYLATRHLIDLGHRRIGLIAGPQYASSAAGRLAGYHRAFGEAGFAVDPALVRTSEFSIESGEQEATRLLDCADPPTGIFAVNDNTAVGVMAAAHRLGLVIPEQLSVVGYNDIPLARHLPVPLTTVHVPLEQLATSAVELLIEAAAGAPAQTRTVIPSLIPRRSTKRPPADR